MRHRVRSLVQFISGERIIWTMPRSPALYLTFDDGPTEGVTDRILDILDDYGMSATFFVEGKKVEKNWVLAMEIHRRGHLLANHSYSHCREIYDSYSRIKQEITSTNHILESITGERPRYFRPPWGVYNNAGLLWACRRLQMKILLWSFDSKDSFDDVRNYTRTNRISSAQMHDIVLMHDDNALAVEILQRELPEIRRRNMVARRLPE